MKKVIGLLLSVVLLLGTAGIAVSEDLTEDRPVLKFLVNHRTYDPNEDYSSKLMEELTGYKVEYEMLPSTGGDEKLMMEMAAGTEYDIVELTPTMFGKLVNIGVLTPLDAYIETYGDNMIGAVPELAWDSAKNSNGQIVGLPRMNGTYLETTYGTRSDRFFMTKQEIVDELNLTIPTDLDSFTAFLQTIYDAKGVAPLTSASGVYSVWFKDIATAFDLPDITWIETEDGFVNVQEMPGFRPYMRYVAGLYEKGLLDPDVPINKGENVNQKFTTDGAYVGQFAFWDIPSLVPGLETSGLSTDLVTFNQPLKDEDGSYVLVARYGISKYYGIPVSSKVPEHVVNYINLLSEPETFKTAAIGYEGIHHTVDENGNYFPIFPAFNDLNWANQFSGLQDFQVEFRQWQARARKTPEMAVAYDAINSNLEDGFLILDRSTLTSGLPAVQENAQALQVMLSDFMLQTVVENKTSDEDFDAFYARYMAEGGQAVKDAMTEWAMDNPES